MNSTIFIIFLLIIISKWLVFIISLPFVSLLMRLKNRKSEYEKILPSQNSEPIECNNLIHLIQKYIIGYLRYSIFITGQIPSHHIRNFIYKQVYLVKLGKYVAIYHGAEIRDPYKLKIGEGSVIGDGAILDARNGIEIGRNVNFSSNVQLWTEQHDYNDPFFRCTIQKCGSIIIGDYSWIGPNVTILHDITIGEGAVVAAGSVVTKDVEPYSLVAGVPAKKIGERTKDLRYSLKGEHFAFI